MAAVHLFQFFIKLTAINFTLQKLQFESKVFNFLILNFKFIEKTVDFLVFQFDLFSIIYKEVRIDLTVIVIIYSNSQGSLVKKSCLM